MAIKVLVADALSPAAVTVLKKRGITPHVKTGLTPAQLQKIIGQYEGLAVRSSTKVTPALLLKAKRLKVVGRAGIGVDNIDVAAATKKGVVVMNTPFGNSITTAEHTIALMFAMVRKIPQASLSMREGKWEKSKFMGMELFGKKLGVIGCGNIGSIVASLAVGLGMEVLVYDPFLSVEKSKSLGVQKVELTALLKKADIVTLHTPLTSKTRHIINSETLAVMKKGACIINCARGPLIKQEDLKKALDSGHIASCALDVYEEEPPKNNPFARMENAICTPHLGASTAEAQEKVAVQLSEQISEYLLKGTITNALNMPAISSKQAGEMQPLIDLVGWLGSFVGQLHDGPVTQIIMEYEGNIVHMNTKALTSAAMAGFLRPTLPEVNMVNAASVLRERGVRVREVMSDKQASVFERHVRLRVRGGEGRAKERSVAGTVFSDGKLRLIQLDGINMEAEVAHHMLYIRNKDKAGFLGKLGSILGKDNINIAALNLGRDKKGGMAVTLVCVDAPPKEALMRKLLNLEYVLEAHALKF